MAAARENDMMQEEQQKEVTSENIPKLESTSEIAFCIYFMKKTFFQYLKENGTKRNQIGMKERIPKFIVKKRP